MDVPTYESDVIVGGVDQTTNVSAMPRQIVTRQSGQLNLPFYDKDNQPFDITGLSGTDAKFVPYNSAEVPVTAGTGVVSYTGEIFTLTSAGPTAGTFTLTVDSETTGAIAYNADEAAVLSALEALGSRSPGDFDILLTGGSNLGDSGAVMEIRLSGGFDIDDRSFGDFSGLTAANTITLAVTREQSTVQNFYSVTWVQDTIPAIWSTFEPEDRDGAIALTVELDETGTADFFQVYTRFNVTDGNLAGNQQSVPIFTFLLYYNPVYEYDNTTTDADPGAGKFRMNNTTLSSVTEMYFADDANTNVNMSSHLQSMGVGSKIYVGNPNVQTSAALFTVSAPAVNNTGYTTVNVTYNDSGTGSFTNGEYFSFTFDSTGDSLVPGITYDYDSTITDSDPGAGNFRLNNAAPASATFIYVADDDKGGVNESAYLQGLRTGDFIRFNELTTQTSSASYTVNGTPTNATGYTKIPVTYVDSGAGSFTNGNECSFTIDKSNISTLYDPLDTNGNIIQWSKGADVASAAALTLGSDGNSFDITGTTTITSINTIAVGTYVMLQFDAALTLTHNATDLILPGNANITTAAGDIATFYEYATGDWRCVSYQLQANAPGGGACSGFPDTDNDKTAAYTVVSGDVGENIVFSGLSANVDCTLDVSLLSLGDILGVINEDSTYSVRVVVSNTSTMTLGSTKTDQYLWQGETVLFGGDTSTNARFLARP